MNNMYDAMDTILYPMVSFSIERISEGKLIINVPRLIKNMSIIMENTQTYLRLM